VPRCLPFVASLFPLVLFSNLIGPKPGFILPASDINTHLALAAAIVFLAMLLVGVRLLDFIVSLATA